MQKPCSKDNLSQLIDRLVADYPDIKFAIDSEFHWSPERKILFYKNDNLPESPHLLLHELAHATLSHQRYFYDNELVKMELDAWEHSRQNFYPKYHTNFDQNLADDYLDYYRNWLYARSCCPSCQMIGQQDKTLDYHCLSCHQRWRASPAKTTQLKRHKIK